MTALTILADENIAALDDYFAPHTNIRLIKLAGRQIPELLPTYRPDIVLVRSVTPVNAKTFKEWQPKFVGTATLGIDHIDTKFLADNGIGFASAIGSSKHSVAQYVITAILTARPSVLTTRTTLGIVGLGNIGTTLAHYANELGWQVVGYDPFLPKSAINRHDFEQILACDIVSLHTPLTKTGDFPTYKIIDSSALAKMPASTLLINAARGQVVDNLALLDNIKKTHRQVVLDVFFDEPFVSKALLDNLTLATPHIAGYTLDAKLRGTQMMYQAICDKFELPILQTMDKLLPQNPYAWQTLKSALLQGDLSLLPQFYDIKQDDTAIRNLCGKDGVCPVDFDKLRKEYPLKREWR